jgi:L-ascorbate metabolism protein UlaG (beta-lactamase superfamily)/nitrite reductase/ring-hydroxylating ferredoxin subunit
MGWVRVPVPAPPGEGDSVTDAPLVTSLGHAGLRVETADLRLLFDPWLTGPAFLGSWYPLPDNRFMLTGTTLDCDWVAVSHEHQDHLDLRLLAALPDRVRVVIPKYPSAHLRVLLHEAGVRHVVEVGAWERLALNDSGDWLTVIPEVSPMCHDSGILVVANGYAVLHMNDARLSVAQLRRAAAEAGRDRIDFLGVQMSGASWHPICYDYPADVVARVSSEKRVSKFRSVTRLVRNTTPRLVVPYAGPPCFLDAEVARHNQGIPEPGLFPDPAQATAWLRDKLPAQRSLHLLPGDSIDVGSAAVAREPRWESSPFEALEPYLEDYAARRAGEIAAARAAYPDPDGTVGLADLAEEHFVRLGELSPYFLARIGFVLRFEVDGPEGGRWDVHLGPDKVSVDRSGRAASPAYRIRVASRWLWPVVSGRAGWEDLFLSLRFSAARDPDRYNDYLVGLLKHADAAALSAVERYEVLRDPDETVEVADGDRRFQVSRYCPHAGEDLREGGVVTGGVLRCLAHNFEFDLSSGTCLNARCDPISVRPVQPVR